MNHRHRSHGFSLVELMVAVTIGLLLLAGVLQILLASRQSFEAQRGSAHLQENLRLAEFVLSHAIAHAGYREDLLDDDDSLFPALDGTPPLADGGVINGLYGGPRASNSDILRLRLQSQAGIQDCTGGEQLTPSDSMTFRLSADGTTLLCDNGRNPIAQPIVDNVDRFKLRFGLDTDGKHGVDTYVYDVADGLSPTQQREVRSVRIQLLLHSDPADGDRALPIAVSQSYRFVDGTVFMVTDRRKRVLLDRTIVLENLLQ